MGKSTDLVAVWGSLDITMLDAYHQGMRTTLTLDEDVAARLQAESRRVGRPFREIVTETLRRGLANHAASARRQPFKVEARDLGELQPGLSLDNVWDLVEQVEGRLHR
jgi:hypothetical protein